MRGLIKPAGKSSAVAKSQTSGKQFFSGTTASAVWRAVKTIAVLTSQGVYEISLPRPFSSFSKRVSFCPPPQPRPMTSTRRVLICAAAAAKPFS